MPVRLAVIGVGEGQIAASLCLRSRAVFREIKPFSVGRKEGELGLLRAVLCVCLTVYVCSHLPAAGVRWRRARLGGPHGEGPSAGALRRRRPGPQRALAAAAGQCRLPGGTAGSAPGSAAPGWR